MVKSQPFQERFIRLGGYDAVGNTPEEFRRFLAEDRLRGQELVRTAGVKIASEGGPTHWSEPRVFLLERAGSLWTSRI